MKYYFSDVKIKLRAEIQVPRDEFDQEVLGDLLDHFE